MTVPRSDRHPWLAGSVVIPFTAHGWWNTAHGVVLGGLYLVTLSLAALAVLAARERDLSPSGFPAAVRQVRAGTAAAALIGWFTVVTGTWGIYPWFRAATPDSPSTLLTSRPSLAFWADWVVASKAWVAWVSVVLATLAAVLAYRWGRRFAAEPRLRRRLVGVLALALACAGYAAAVGTLLAKLAPVR